MTSLPRQPEPEPMNLPDEARAYAEADFAEVNQAFVDRLLEVCGPTNRTVALDLGAGPADIPIRVLRARPAWRITAVDVSRAMLDLARTAIEQAGLGEAIDLHLGDAKALPLSDSKYGVIFSNSILHHVTDTLSLWREVRRLAAPDAVIFFRDLYRPASAEQARRLVELHAGQEGPLLREEFHRSLLSAYTPQEVRVQLEAAGLKELTVETVTDRHMDIFGRLGQESGENKR